MNMLLYIQHHEKHILFEARYSSEVAPGAVDSGVAIVKAAKRGNRFSSSSVSESVKRILFGCLWQAQDKWFKRFPQHRPIFLSVISEPAFP